MRERRTARIILLSEARRVLLFRIGDTSTLYPGMPRSARWIGPGGAIERGETPLEAAHRELFEETGLRGLTLSEQIAVVTHDITLDGETLRFIHHVFIATTGAEEIDHSGMGEEELSVVAGSRWWSIEELRAENPDVRPPGFVELVERVLNGGIGRRQMSPD